MAIVRKNQPNQLKGWYTHADFIDWETYFDGNELLEDHAVLVEDDIISICAPTSELSGFDGVLVEASGNILLPGLFDYHVHLEFFGSPVPFQELTNLSAGGVTIKALENAQANLLGCITSLRDCSGNDYLEFVV